MKMEMFTVVSFFTKENVSKGGMCGRNLYIAEIVTGFSVSMDNSNYRLSVDLGKKT